MNTTTKKLTFKQVKTIDVTVKEWFDKSAGNSYFSARIIFNYGISNEYSISLPFQYGYGDLYEDMAMKEIIKLFPRVKLAGCRLWQLREKGVILHSEKIRNCTKKEAVNFA